MDSIGCSSDNQSLLGDLAPVLYIDRLYKIRRMQHSIDTLYCTRSTPIAAITNVVVSRMQTSIDCCHDCLLVVLALSQLGIKLGKLG